MTLDYVENFETFDLENEFKPVKFAEFTIQENDDVKEPNAFNSNLLTIERYILC